MLESKKKRILWITMSAIAATVLGLLILFQSTGAILKTAINEWGPKLTGVETRVSEVSINPWTGSGTIRGLYLGNPKGYSAKPAIEIRHVDIRVNFKSLTAPVVEIVELQIRQPHINLEGGLRQNNLTQILDHLQKQKKSDASSGHSPKVRIRTLKIIKAHLSMMVSGLPDTDLDLPDIEMQNFSGSASEVTSEILKSTLHTVITAPRLLQNGFGKAVDGIKNFFSQ